MKDEAPFDLGVVGDERTPDEPPAPPESGGAPGRWVWAVVALALVVGGTLGAVITEARDDTAGYTDIRLVSGALQAISDRADPATPASVEVSLLNLGEHEIEILGLEPAGMTVQPDQEAGEPVVAPPGEWVTASQTGLVADCSATEPGDGVRVRVRDGDGDERVVEADGLPDGAGANQAWWMLCQEYTGLFGLNDATAVTHDAESLTMDLSVSNAGEDVLQVLEFEPDTPGMVAPAPEVPFEVLPGAAVTIPLTWTVTDCEAALQWPDVSIIYEVSEAGGDSQGHHPLAGQARAELVLLVQRVCGL